METYYEHWEIKGVFATRQQAEDWVLNHTRHGVAYYSYEILEEIVL